jgi:hypothetical protein
MSISIPCRVVYETVCPRMSYLPKDPYEIVNGGMEDKKAEAMAR